MLTKCYFNDTFGCLFLLERQNPVHYWIYGPGMKLELAGTAAFIPGTCWWRH